MDEVSPELVRRSVRIQSNVRVKLGLPVAAFAIVVALYEASPGNFVGPLVGVIATYILYALLTFLVARRPGRLSWQEIAVATAVLDPIIYSAWLFFGGESAILVIGFYIFTILGFGFRIGPRIMRLCQGVSILGFTWVLVASPFWKTHPFFGLSHLILLLAVPMYAGMLMRELREAKARAERESQAKNQLLANVSHELRTPLTGIVSAAQLLEAGSTSRESDRLVAKILKLSNSLDAEISQLLDLSKLGAQPASGAPVPFDLRSIIGNVQAALQETAAGKGVELVVDVDPEIRQSVLGRPRDLESVLMNLAGNAVKFTLEGRVHLDVRLVDSDDDAYRLRFEVADTGIGIPLEHQERLFEPFYRVETGDRRQFRGTGLGTTIAREHVRRMGGELQLSSAPGEGSRFWFEIRLPVSRTQATVAGEARGTPAVAPKRILIADDNATNLELLQQMLLKDGHAVTTAGNGTDALQHLATASFDVVMLDFNMGDLDGLTVFQTYSFGRLQTAPTFFVTADTSADTASKLGQAGAAGVMYKPLTFEKLRRALLSAFPDEAGDAPAPAPAPALPTEPAPVVRLSAVPVELVDASIVDTLREVRDQPAFISRMLGDGIDDLRTLRIELAQSIADQNLADVHSRAHAMRGVAVSVGAVRLAALCERLMKIPRPQLASSGDRLLADLAATFDGTLVALENLRSPFVSAASRSA
jgi:two-component system sensor histidine kinase RpfC